MPPPSPPGPGEPEPCQTPPPPEPKRSWSRSTSPQVSPAWGGTALPPFLALLDAQRQQAFLDDYRARVQAAYPRRGDGSVLFPFRRQFIVAVRTGER